MSNGLHNEWLRWRGIEAKLAGYAEQTQLPESLVLLSRSRKLNELRAQVRLLHRATSGQLQDAVESLNLLIADLVGHFDDLVSPLLTSELHEARQRARIIEVSEAIDWVELYALLTGIIESLMSQSVAKQKGTLIAVTRLQARKDICLRIPDWLVTLKGEEVSPEVVDRFRGEIAGVISV